MLMRDGVVMVSVMPFTNWPTSSLATPSACSRGRSPATLESLVLSIATTVSQYSRSFSRPFLAFLYLYLSKEKGSVTTPIFRMPSPGSAFASTFMAPVPVPPPNLRKGAVCATQLPPLSAPGGSRRPPSHPHQDDHLLP